MEEFQAKKKVYLDLKVIFLTAEAGKALLSVGLMFMPPYVFLCDVHSKPSGL